MGEQGRIGYLDGIRALAIVGVILFHWSGLVGGIFPGGYIGVDLFFVLSGYIITRILWSRGEQLGYRGFLLARVKRLYPALIGVVVVGAALVVALGDSWKRTGVASALALGQLNSIAVPLGLPFDPFGVTWSLSGEWMSYLVLPLLLAAARRLGPHRAAALFAALAVGLWLLATLLPAPWFYFGPVTRAGQIFAGGALALVLVVWRPGPRGGAVFGVLGILAAAGLIAWGIRGVGPLTAEYAWVGFPAVTVAAGLLVLSGALAPLWPIARVLALSPLALLGRVSYSLYLWHVMGFAVFGRFSAQWPTPLYAAVCAAFVIVATALSYRFLERPFLRSRSAALTVPVTRA